MSLVSEIMTAKENGQSPKEKLEFLQAKVEELESLKADIKAMEELLSATKARVQLIENFELPDYMLEVGMRSATLLNGKQIEIKPYYYARIPPVDEKDEESYRKREEALDWLREHRYGGIIKENLIITPEHADVALIKDFLKDMGTSYEEKSSVHWKTLESWLREQIGKGTDIPLEKFNAFVGRVAKVK